MGCQLSQETVSVNFIHEGSKKSALPALPCALQGIKFSSLGNMRVMRVASCCELRVVASKCELPFSGPFSHFCYYCLIVTCSLQHLSRLRTFFILNAHRGSMDQGCVDHRSQSFGVNGNSDSNGNMTHREGT